MSTYLVIGEGGGEERLRRGSVWPGRGGGRGDDRVDVQERHGSDTGLNNSNQGEQSRGGAWGFFLRIRPREKEPSRDEASGLESVSKERAGVMDNGVNQARAN